MSQLITFRGLDEQTGVYAQVKRKDDGSWWNENTHGWDAAVSVDCNLPLNEGDTGIYTGWTALSPRAGAKYIIYVYNSDDALIMYTETVMSGSERRTALQIVQEIQKAQRLPQATDFSKAHDKLTLAFVNRAIDLMYEAGQWDSLDIAGGITIEVGKDIYTIDPINSVNMDVISHLQISTDLPLVHIENDADFREYKRQMSSSESQPLKWRLYGRQGRAILIQVAPTPETSYLLDFEGQQKPVALVLVGDVCVMDSDTVIDGGLMLSKEEAGLDFLTEKGIFEFKLDSRAKAEGDGNWGDMIAG